MKTLKQFLALGFVMLLLAIEGLAQGIPQAISYQAVARDGSGNLLANQGVDVRFTIRQTIPTGTAVYVETQATSTNDYGLFNLEIGNGTVSSGVFVNIDWINDFHFLEVEVDPGGGYVNMGVMPFLSAPYSFVSRFSKKATNMKIDELTDVNPGTMIATGSVLKWNGTEWTDGTDLNYWTQSGSDIYYTGGQVGIGTTAPAAGLEIKGASYDAAVSLNNTNGGTEWRVVSWGDGDLKFVKAPGSTFTAMSIESTDGSVGIGTSSPTQKLDVVGAVRVRDDLAGSAAPDKGVVYANSMPVAYGNITISGAIVSDFGVASVTNPNTGEYQIVLDQSLAAMPAVVVTCLNSSPNDEVATYNWSSVTPNTIEVNISNGSGTPAGSQFGFVVFGTVQ